MLTNLWNLKINIFQLMFISWTRGIQLEKAPRAWYERHGKFLINSSLIMKKIGTLLLINKNKWFTCHTTYVDDIIFGATNEYLSEYFTKWWKENMKWPWWRNLGSFSSFKSSKQVMVFLLTNPSMPMIYLRFHMESVKPCGTPRISSTKINNGDYKYLLTKRDIEVRLVVFYIWHK